MQFGRWVSLTDEGLESAPAGPAAVQLRREAGLIDYPSGKSAMVFYVWVGSNVRTALRSHFATELAQPGSQGQGPLLYRWSEDVGGQQLLQALLAGFERRFGSAPILHDGARARADGHDA